jgi:hypothetical protein
MSVKQYVSSTVSCSLLVRRRVVCGEHKGCAPSPVAHWSAPEWPKSSSFLDGQLDDAAFIDLLASAIKKNATIASLKGERRRVTRVERLQYKPTWPIAIECPSEGEIDNREVPQGIVRHDLLVASALLWPSS